ncbi:SRPBCC family protein [Nocardiopsis sp. N85]|uniref:SRPBCC family protein n=1 Tax=Nocardiopsis sp. N85 TaxID=3029400 RepID=UPI00237F3FC9|nr:SRPBCC family protein [Nocardiopsis sp. N85]MDE3719948.1 SRPBCC family protein [Nocardiopsis sp. N85]
MRFEKSIHIEAPRQRVWHVLTDIEAWPRVIRLVEVVEVVASPPLEVGGTVRLRELPEGLWDITVWDTPAYFEFAQKADGATTVVCHRVDALGGDRSHLMLNLEMRGLMVAVISVLPKKTTRTHLDRQAEDLKNAAEATPWIQHSCGNGAG